MTTNNDRDSTFGADRGKANDRYFQRLEAIQQTKNGQDLVIFERGRNDRWIKCENCVEVKA